MSKLITVVGATGNQGSSVVKTFLKLPGWKVRGITRNPNSEAAKALQETGVELVVADLDSTASLITAFSGAQAIFGVTDFWQFASDKATFAAAEKRGVAPNVICFERELDQFKNIINAAASVLVSEKKLERLVMSSLSHTRKLSGGTLTNNLHFDGKAIGVEYLQTSTSPDLIALKEITSYVQIGAYLDNWKKGFIMGPKQLEDGSFIYRSTDDADSNAKIPMVHPPTDTGPFVEALVVRNPPQTTMLGTSQLLTASEYAELLAKHFGKPVAVQHVRRADLIDSMGETFGNEVADSGEYVSKYGWTGGADGVGMPWELGVKMDEVTKPEQYIRETDWSSVMYQPETSL